MSMKKQADAAGRRVSGFSKGILLFLCFALLFTACARETPGDADETSEEPLLTRVSCKTAYFSSDSLNPYFCTTSLNASLMPMVYAGLFSIQRDGTAEPDVAASYTESENEVKIVLPTTGVFSDGSAVTANDVVYSFEKAKSSAVYAQQMSGIAEAKADSPLEVTFSFSDKLPDRLLLLTFPIVKNQTAETADARPIGTGQYRWTESEDETVLTLCAGESESQIETVRLIPVSDSSNLMYTLQTGEIDFFVSDLFGGRLGRTGGQMVDIPTSNLIFLGINSDSYALSFPPVRQALSFAVNRDEIAQSVYSGHAVAADLPIRPDTRAYSQNAASDQQTAVDYAAAQHLLESEGYTTVDPQTGTRSGDKGSLRMSLLVNNESEYRLEVANCVQDSLARVGVSITIHSLPYDQYVQTLTEGGYDLYIGEIKLPNNGSLSAFFGGSVSYGISDQSKSYLAWQEVLSGTVALPAFFTTFTQDLPFLPLAFRNDVLVSSDDIEVPDEAILFGSALSQLDRWRVQEEETTEEGTTASLW